MKKKARAAALIFLAGVTIAATLWIYFNKGEPYDKTNLSHRLSILDRNKKTNTQKFSGRDFAPIVKKVRPAVVKIIAESSQPHQKQGNDFLDEFFNLNRENEFVIGMGSGFFISNDGFIITNHHLVRKAEKVKVITLQGKEYPAKIIGLDSRTDLALLKIQIKDIPSIELGDSNNAEVGEWVLAIGNPLEQDLSVTSGIISARGRRLGVSEYEDFIQTDASINRGNSGGPLVSLKGEVIGINSVILTPSGGSIGLGFAIPSNMAIKVVRDLLAKGRVMRGYLGIQVEMAEEKDAIDLGYPGAGAIIFLVKNGSPAEKAGLKRFDLITEVDGVKIKNKNDVDIRVADKSPDDTIEMTVYSGNQQKKIKIKLTELPPSEEDEFQK